MNQPALPLCHRLHVVADLLVSREHLDNLESESKLLQILFHPSLLFHILHGSSPKVNALSGTVLETEARPIATKKEKKWHLIH